MTMASDGTGRAERRVTLGMDARAVHSTGVGRYVREMLAALFADPRFGHLVLLGDPDELHALLAELGVEGQATVRPFLRSWSSHQTQLAWARMAARGQTRADVWHFPFSDVPLLLHPRRSVVTVHDLIPIKLPGLVRKRERIASTIALHAGARLAWRMIADSESTRRDIVSYVPRAANKVEVVPLGVAPSFRPLEPAEAALCSRAEALRPYLFCVGNRFPHKNHVAAVDALARVRAGGSAMRLVVAGGTANAHWPQVVRHAEARGVADAVVDLGKVSETELRCLYAHCTAFLFPSLYEGFGLPVLEAMACGAPVIASNRSSVPEVMGEGGLSVDPGDSQAMADAVARLERDPGVRGEWIRKGREQAARFTWESTTQRTMEILHRAACS
ncbi:MAG TPA: glycosyltransferase family 1 protein [Longimicrobium sp.]|jgi:glycosyltransferase involved in cell wall biosynthesis